MIPIYISCSWDIQMREINIFTDGGRPCRPAYYYDPSKKMYAFQAKSILKLLTTRKFSWKHLVGGFGIKQINHNSFFTTTDMTNIVKLYDELPENITFEKMMNRSAVVEYIDVSEENNAMFAFRPDDKVKPGSAQFTHSDIHPSLMFGVMGNLISFPKITSCRATCFRAASLNKPFPCTIRRFSSDSIKWASCWTMDKFR